MTTVAWDGNILACDSLMTWENNKMNVEKMHSVPFGVAAISGTWHFGMEIIEWLRNSQDPEKYPIHSQDDENNSTVMFVNNLKELIIYESYSHIPMRLTGCHSEGSGLSAAKAAMLCGKDAIQAVVIASKIDKSTNDEIWVGEPITQRIYKYEGGYKNEKERTLFCY